MMLLTNKAYDIGKHLVQVVLPATGAAYFGLSEIYDWSNGSEVVGTITIITTFLGIALGFSSKVYNAQDPGYGGALHIHKPAPNEPSKFVFSLDADSIDWDHANQVVFEVKREDDEFWNRKDAE